MSTESSTPVAEAHTDNSVIEIGIVLINNTAYTLTLIPPGSHGLGSAPWPNTIPPHSQVPSFRQGGTTQVKFSALYGSSGSGEEEQVLFEGYWTLGWLHSATINPSPPNAFSGSAVNANNEQATYTLNGS